MNDMKFDNAQPSLTVAQEQEAFSIVQPYCAPGVAGDDMP